MNWTPFVPNSEAIHQQGGRYPTPDNFCESGAIGFAPHYKGIDYFSKNQNVNVWDVQKKKDQDFIENFVTNLKQKKSQATRKPLNVHEAKCLLLNIFSLKKDLQEKSNLLDVNEENFDSQWKNIEQQMNQIKEKIMELDENMELLKIHVSKKFKQSSSRKKRKIKKKVAREKLKEQINVKHKAIDKVLNDKKEEVAALKRESALKRQADSVLHEVRRKKNEGSKMLNLLTTLAKLRELRIEEEEKKGGYCSKQLTNVFNEVINRFKILWEKQIETYKLEEKGLKIMLEENTLPCVKESKFESNLLHWEEALFGPASTDEISSANESIEAFIQVRQEWDCFLAIEPTAISSSIPTGWVLPPETDDEDWLKYIKRSKTF